MSMISSCTRMRTPRNAETNLEQQNMKISETITAALLASTLVFSLSACDEGPMEEAGENVDDAVEESGDAIEDTTDGN